jgi:hypothetical protein
MLQSIQGTLTLPVLAGFHLSARADAIPHPRDGLRDRPVNGTETLVTPAHESENDGIKYKVSLPWL